MTSTTARPLAPVDSATRRVTSAKYLGWLEGQALAITLLAAVAVFSLAQIPQHLIQDSWLALVGGRYVATQGLPHHDTLFLITHGARWIDQQWLSQLALYELARVGGLALYGVVYVVLEFVGITIALAVGRAFGGSERHMLWVLPLAAALYFLGSLNIRTQGFAYPLFAVTLWLLAREARGARDRLIYLVFPILVLWGNLHGSVTLGVALAMLCGAVLVAQDLRHEPRRLSSAKFVRGRAVALLVLSPLLLLVNPYGLSIVSYYGATLFNSQFGKVVTEWEPVTTRPVAAVMVFALAAAMVWVMGRSGRRMPAFEQLALLLLGVGAIFALRNISWYGLGLVMLLPGAVTRLSPDKPVAPRRTRVNLTLVCASLITVLVTLVVVAAKPARWFQSGYAVRAATKVAEVAREHPDARIYADNRFADWLLWLQPGLIGRIAYDIRFELLTQSQLQEIVDLTELPRPGERYLLSSYGIFVLDPANGASTQRILARPGTRVILRSHKIDVAEAPRQ